MKTKIVFNIALKHVFRIVSSMVQSSDLIHYPVFESDDPTILLWHSLMLSKIIDLPFAKRNVLDVFSTFSGSRQFRW